MTWSKVASGLETEHGRSPLPPRCLSPRLMPVIEPAETTEEFVVIYPHSMGYFNPHCLRIVSKVFITCSVVSSDMTDDSDLPAFRHLFTSSTW